MEEEVKQLRSRIKEEFSEEDLDFLHGLVYSGYFDSNNDKADAILFRFKDRGFVELAPATNRFALLRGEYVYKFALDRYGIKDNNNEFNLSEELQPFVTKTYETNGYILIAEYVNLISENEFMDSKENIRMILSHLSEDWLFSDVGTITKNFTNWGYTSDGQLVILDYGYFYKKDPKILFCESDGGSLVYDENFDQLRCTSCGRKYNVVDIKYRMDISEEEYEKQRNKNIKGPLVIGFRGVNVGADGKAYAMKKGK